MTAVRPASVALLALVVYDIFPHSILNWQAAVISVIVFALAAFMNWHPALLIVLCAVTGVVLFGH